MFVPFSPASLGPNVVWRAPFCFSGIGNLIKFKHGRRMLFTETIMAKYLNNIYFRYILFLLFWFVFPRWFASRLRKMGAYEFFIWTHHNCHATDYKIMLRPLFFGRFLISYEITRIICWANILAGRHSVAASQKRNATGAENTGSAQRLLSLLSRYGRV